MALVRRCIVYDSVYYGVSVATCGVSTSSLIHAIDTIDTICEVDSVLTSRDMWVGSRECMYIHRRTSSLSRALVCYWV